MICIMIVVTLRGRRIRSMTEKRRGGGESEDDNVDYDEEGIEGKQREIGSGDGEVQRRSEHQ